MEIAQIINPKNNPVNSSTAKRLYEEVQVHNDIQDTGNGKIVDVDGKSAVLLYVSGEFNASIYVHGSLDGTTYPHEQLNIYSIFEEKMRRISQNRAFISLRTLVIPN